MESKLVVIAGPLQGTVFALAEDEISIGRDTTSGVRLGDPSVSRQHSLVRREGPCFKIVDLDSFNGTYVNGIPVLEHSLHHGDQIAVGDVLLLFLLDGAEDEAPQSAVQLDDSKVITQTTILLRREEAFYLQPEKVMAALPPTARIARDLNALLKISTVVNSTRDGEALRHRLLEMILEVVPAERGAILLVGEGSEEFVSSVSWGRRAGRQEVVRVSQTAALRAMREGVAVLCNDVSQDRSLGPAESLVGTEVRALVCVPLALLDKPLGVIYLDTRDTTNAFDEHHLQLVTAIAGIASAAVENIRRAEHLETENRRLNQEIQLRHQMVGESTRMQELYRFIAKVATAESSVLLRGESGTGKELAARAIHMNSPRAEKAFVAINCATLTETLLESELFGHERGAFTGAVAQKKGKLEVADGGTLFLDEVGELAPNIQAKLLRVLQEREFERVGGTRPIKVDIRVIAATNRDLEEAVRQGTFRQDLFYRLNVISFTLPPLRERREDIPLLANYFAAESSKRVKRKPVRISPEARSYFVSYNWPGNVRELANVIERAVVLGSTETILPEDLPDALLETAEDAPDTKFYDALREAKKQMLLNAVQQSGGNYAEAAKLLGIHPNNLHRLMKNLNLKPRPSK
jgi:Nif-specific regulatory protein